MSVAALALLGPLAAAALILILRRAAAALAVLGAAAGAAAAALTLARVADGSRFATTLPGMPTLPLRLVVDPLAALLSTMVAVVALLVLVYAVGYMGRERDQARFFTQMSFFAAAMQTLVLAGDWILFLAAWELIGLASYLLIGFWYERPAVPAAATRAFLTTRSADLGLYLAVFVLVTQSGTTAIAPTLHVGGQAGGVAGFLLLVAAMGKAAQVPLQGWLQDAMLGPTPVSALLHSATLVAAGAILLARAFPLLPPPVLFAVGLVGGATALVTGSMAVAQRDLKRLLAASTSSQLGLMFLALGAASVGAAVAQLIAHAAMKGALFLGAGIFQEAYDATAFDRLRGAGWAHPRVFLGFTVAGLALAGVPPLAGFWTKGAIDAAAFASPHAWLFAPLALVSTLLTGAYVARALGLLWHGTAPREPVAGSRWMGAALAVLALLAATLGLAVEPIGDLLGVPIPRDLAGALLGLIAAAAGLWLGWSVPAERLLGPATGAAEIGFRIGSGWVGLVVQPALALARQLDRLDGAIHRVVLAVGRAGLGIAGAARRFDEQRLDGLVAALVVGTRSLGMQVRRLQSGFVSRELVLAVGGGALIVACLLITQ
jgi:NADH-quinone oxidoreductase subunit L